jgi:hypothetical protein
MYHHCMSKITGFDCKSRSRKLEVIGFAPYRSPLSAIVGCGVNIAASCGRMVVVLHFIILVTSYDHSTV